MDNDVLIKLSSYRLLPHVVVAYGGGQSVGVLGAARYVVTSAIERHPRLQGKAEALDVFVGILQELLELEPTKEELDLATEIEEAAAAAGEQLDSGESQLCAISLVRVVERIITGDKRAIQAAERILPVVNVLTQLAGRLLCLEQLFEALVAREGVDPVRALVCAEPGVDRAMSICMLCASYSDGSPFDPSGLESYIGDVRQSAPTLLAETAGVA